MRPGAVSVGMNELDSVTSVAEYMIVGYRKASEADMRMLMAAIMAVAVALAAAPARAQAQDIPSDYQTVMTTLGKKGDFKDGVLKVNIPRGDLTVTIGGRAAPTPFGFGGWVALTKDAAGGEVLMGDLVLTEDEVNPVMSALLDNGLDVTALHNHFFWEQPRIFYMHVHGRGSASDLATRLKPAIGLIDAAAKRSTPSAAPAAGALDAAALAKIVGHQGEQNGPVYKITIGRADVNVKEHGATINARMGLNTSAAFAGSNGDAMVAGDVAMLEHEVTPVLKVLRANGINIVAIHHHMTEVQPMVVFLHYYGTGPAEQLARAVRAAVDVLGKSPASHASHGGASANGAAANAPAGAAAKQVLFMCPHGAAKSVLASAYFQKLAKERGLNVRVDSVGTDPDPEVGKAVAAHLTKTGYAIPIDKPRRATARDVEQADIVVSLGCDLAGLPQPRGKLLKWDDVPGPGENFAAADEAIHKRVEALVDELARATGR
jgi:protein-tyrosine-phosphatase